MCVRSDLNIIQDKLVEPLSQINTPRIQFDLAKVELKICQFKFNLQHNLHVSKIYLYLDELINCMTYL